MVIEVRKFGNEVWINDFGTHTCGHLVDTATGVMYAGDIELLKLYNGSRRGLVDDDKLGALYRSVEGGAKKD